MPDQIDLSKMESVGVYVNNYLRIRRYWGAPSEDFWDKLWKNTKSKEYWKDALDGHLPSEFRNLIHRYVKLGAKILEAGCGVGHLVLALRTLGYNCHGIDFAPRTIDLLKTHFPDVPFKLGDIRNLPYANDFFDAYISLGVIEHFIEGQDQMLAEAARVLSPGGKIFISVPAVNGYRLFKYNIGLYRKSSKEPFFEDCYTLGELRDILAQAGFSYLEHCYQNTVMTFVQESFLRPLYLRIEDTRFLRGGADKLLSIILPRAWFGHMLMIVGEKSNL